MTRTVADLVRVLDVMVGYDPEDPVTAMGVGHIPETYTAFLDRDGLRGARIGVLRESIGFGSEPESTDFRNVTAVFDQAVEELREAGAEIVDPIVIPNIVDLLRGNPTDLPDGTELYLSRTPTSPFKTREDIRNSPDYEQVFDSRRGAAYAPGAPAEPTGTGGSTAQIEARDELMINIMKVMVDHNLDAIVHKSIEHTPTLISDGVNPPFVNRKGSPRLTTFLVYAATMSVPAGFTPEGLPVGITFFGKPYSEPTLIKLAYAYEQATLHRIPPSTTPPLQ